MSIKDKVLAFFKEEEGLTTVEYAVAGGVIATGVIASFLALGGNVADIINWIQTELAKSPHS
jgi:pilus assembly protein Flp/PilA